jgi:carbon-monoxide dehydrogenase large subunit
VAVVAEDGDRLPEGEASRPLVEEVDFVEAEPTYPFGAHVAVVEVDVQTGDVRLLRHVAVDDCGRVLDPAGAEAQVHGGVAQGVGQALYEEMVHDAEGNPLSASLLDYAVPTAGEIPTIETDRTETPTPHNPLGAKGVGESGTIGSTPAVQNAVIDALSHLGVRHLDMPLTPEKVWRALRTGGGSSPT